MTQQDPRIVVSIHEELIVLIGTPDSFVVQSDNKEYVRIAKENMERTRQVPLISSISYATFPTGKSTMLELAASLVAINPGAAQIREAPQEVVDALEKVTGPVIPGAVY